jgi:thioredoxin 1
MEDEERAAVVPVGTDRALPCASRESLRYPTGMSGFKLHSPRRAKWLRLRLTLLFIGIVGPAVGSWYVFYVPSNDVVWAADFDTAQRQAAETGRPMVLYFSAEWCTPCRIMRRQVWADREVESIVGAGFVAVTIDVKDTEAKAAAFERYPVGAWPTTVVTDAQGNVLAQAAGGLSKSEFLGLLEQARKS